MSQSRSSWWAPRWVVVVAGAVAVGLVLYGLRAALTPVFFAFLIAYMLDPVIDRLEARRIPRAFGIGVALSLVLAAIAIVLVFVLPSIVGDLVAFAAEVPARVDTAWGNVQPFLRNRGIEVPVSLGAAVSRLELGGAQIASAAAPAGAAIGWLVGGTASVIGTTVGLLMIPVFAGYLLHDFDRIIASTRDLVPIRFRSVVVARAREVDAVLGEFVRGQFIVMLILGGLYSVAYLIVGVRLAVLIGVVAGLVSFIPYVGGVVALGLALLMCLLDWQGVGQLVAVVVAYTIIQLLEGFLITPKIVGDKVGLAAVWVLFALMVGAELFGFMGILLALPAAAVAKIFVVRALHGYRTSAWFSRGADALLPAAPSDADSTRGTR